MDVVLHETLTGHQNPIYTLESDEVRGVLYSAGNDKGVVEWDWDTLQFRRILCAVPSSVYTLHTIPNTDLLAVGMRSGEIYIVDTVQQTLRVKLKVDTGSVFCIRSSPRKQELIAIGEEGKAYVWSMGSFELLYTFKVADTTVRIMAIDEQEQYLAFGDKNGFVHVCHVEDYHLLATKQIHEKAVTSLCFMQGSLLSGGRDAKMYKLSYPDLEIQKGITPHMFTVYGISALNTTSFSTISRDKTLKIWNEDLRLQKNISRDKGIESHFLSINSQVYHQQLGLLATAGDDKMIKIWRLSY